MSQFNLQEHWLTLEVHVFAMVWRLSSENRLKNIAREFLTSPLIFAHIVYFYLKSFWKIFCIIPSFKAKANARHLHSISCVASAVNEEYFLKNYSKFVLIYIIWITEIDRGIVDSACYDNTNPCRPIQCIPTRKQ